MRRHSSHSFNHLAGGLVRWDLDMIYGPWHQICLTCKFLIDLLLVLENTEGLLW